jgi:uncharacterized membrane protein
MEREILELTAYFIVYSFLGWVLESVVKTVISKKFVNSGFLIGPFCPIYGFGAIIMYLFLEQVSGKPILTFILGFVVLSVWEYLVGAYLEKVFNTKYWDYSENKYNIRGRVCLKNSLFWGFLSVVFIDFIHPQIASQIERLDFNVLKWTVIAIVVYLIIDMIISTISIISIKDQLAKVQLLNESIKDKLEIIKQKGKGLKDIELQETIEALNKQRTRIILKTYRNVHRLKRAFPTMRSEIINAFLKERKELIKTDKKWR